TRCYRDWSSDVCSSDLVDVARLGNEDRRHAPLDRHLAHGPVHVGERDDRTTGAEARDGGGGTPGERGDEQRAGAERLREVAGRVDRKSVVEGKGGDLGR